MFYAMKLVSTGWGTYTVRACRTKGFKKLESARKAVERSGTFGYVKQLNVLAPVWSNVL